MNKHSPRFGAEKERPPEPPKPQEQKPDMAEVMSSTIANAMIAIGKSSEESAILMREAISKIPEQQDRITGLEIIPDMDKGSPRYGMIKKVVFVR